ncbi:hypothetical protein [Nocardia sp. NPDC050710]|uniref:hypothetical protein n=1 Tax=Nocardia sp. NPDC050710 TaxID=3157220 RepID=UPI0033F8A51D
MTNDPGRPPALEVVRELTDASVGLRTGVLRVTGDPGADFRLVRGRVVAVHTPGAPGVPELLARPGRICTGEADLRVLATMAALDGAFATAAGWIGGCFWKEDPPDADPLIPRIDGVEPDRLIAETRRRLGALRPAWLSPHRNQFLRTEYGEAAMHANATGERQQILRQADRLRSCRDLAFLLSRSLFAITVEVARLLREDLLVIPQPTRPTSASKAAESAALPRRRRGASGINELFPPRSPRLGPHRSPGCAEHTQPPMPPEGRISGRTR